MKILHINRNYIDTPLHQLMVERLDSMGYSNAVFVPRRYKEDYSVEPNSNVIVCECFGRVDRFFFKLKQRKILRALENNMSFDGVDLVHAYTLFTDGNCARKIYKKHAIPYVVAVRNTDVNDFFRLMPHLRKLGVRIMMDAKAVFFLSESYRKQVFDKYVPEKYRAAIFKKTYIIPNGVNDYWFENTPETKTSPTKEDVNLIYAGRIDKNKNIPATQRAVSLLKKEGYNARLLVVGKVEDVREYKKIIKDENTTVMPPVSMDALVGLYRNAHIFVMPSFTESFGLVYVEAMSQRLPVIYSKGQGFDGQFEEGVVGYSVDSSSVESIYQGIVKVLENYDMISSNGPSKALKFNWQEIAKEYDRIYRSI